MRSGESIERRKKVNLVYFSPETAAALRWPAEYAPGAAFADFRQAAAEPAADPVDEMCIRDRVRCLYLFPQKRSLTA